MLKLFRTSVNHLSKGWPGLIFAILHIAYEAKNTSRLTTVAVSHTGKMKKHIEKERNTAITNTKLRSSLRHKFDTYAF